MFYWHAWETTCGPGVSYLRPVGIFVSRRGCFCWPCVRSTVVTGHQPVVWSKCQEETLSPHCPKYPPCQGRRSDPHGSGWKPASPLLPPQFTVLWFGGPTLQVSDQLCFQKSTPSIPHHSLACWEWWGRADSVTGTVRQGIFGGQGLFLGCRGPVLVKLLVSALCVCVFVCVLLLCTGIGSEDS